MPRSNWPERELLAELIAELEEPDRHVLNAALAAAEACAAMNALDNDDPKHGDKGTEKSFERLNNAFDALWARVGSALIIRFHNRYFDAHRT